MLVSLSTVALLLWVVYGARMSDRSTRGSSETLTLGASAIDLSSLIWVAKSNGYFSQQNLDIQIRLYESGHLAIRDLLAGKLDLATATEFAAVQHGFQRHDFRIVSVLDQAQDQELVARKDRGIKRLSDLRNKRIGVPPDTSAEHYLHLLLTLEKMRPHDVRIVNVPPSAQVEAMERERSMR